MHLWLVVCSKLQEGRQMLLLTPPPNLVTIDLANDIASYRFGFLRPVADSVALLETNFWFLSLQLASNASFAKAAEPF